MEPSTAEEISTADIQTLLDDETQSNKSESWNKLSKMLKKQKLDEYAKKYVLTHGIGGSEMVAELSTFFAGCLDSQKLQKVKEVIYDRETQEVRDVPALFINPLNGQFKLRNTEKRTSTIKALAPAKKKAGAGAGTCAVEEKAGKDER